MRLNEVRRAGYTEMVERRWGRHGSAHCFYFRRSHNSFEDYSAPAVKGREPMTVQFQSPGSDMKSKADDAFKTISEVALEIGVPKHVLRFWETRFPQVKPMKRGGGRRYYRPEDLVLLNGIRTLLHTDGYTIKGVQKILREQGVESVKDAAQQAVSKQAARDKSRAVTAAKSAGARRLKTAPAPRTAPAADDARATRRERLDIDEAISQLKACRNLLFGLRSANSAVPKKKKSQSSAHTGSAATR